MASRYCTYMLFCQKHLAQKIVYTVYLSKQPLLPVNPCYRVGFSRECNKPSGLYRTKQVHFSEKWHMKRDAIRKPYNLKLVCQREIYYEVARSCGVVVVSNKYEDNWSIQVIHHPNVMHPNLNQSESAQRQSDNAATLFLNC